MVDGNNLESDVEGIFIFIFILIKTLIIGPKGTKRTSLLYLNTLKMFQYCAGIYTYTVYLAKPVHLQNMCYYNMFIR